MKKVEQFFLKDNLIQAFQKMLEKEIKPKLLMEIYKKLLSILIALRGQYGTDCIVLKIPGFFKKGQNRLIHIVFYVFWLYPGFRKPCK